MKLFIDTNIFLSFYSLSNEDLEELKKLVVLLKKNALQLLVTDQVVDEFNRNRDNKIAEAIKKLKEQKLTLQLPVFCKDYPEYEELRTIQKQYEQKHSKLLEKILKDVNSERLKADTTIKQLLRNATLLPVTKEIVSRSRDRFDIGNPPGKNKSLGDAINWEMLLEHVSEGTDLIYISEDKDYYSLIDDQRFNSFLIKEWSRKKKSEILYYKRLSLFFKEHFPEIKLADEYEKDLLIRDLANSGSFSRTHTVVAKMARYSNYSNSQINEIVSIYITNVQVHLIIGDVDVRRFINTTTSGKEDIINSENLQRLKQIIADFDAEEESELDNEGIA